MKRWSLLLALTFAVGQVHATETARPKSTQELWKAECSGCHIPYPPELMSADNWQRLMGGLDKHFGANAMLDSADNKKILRFLELNSSSGRRYTSASTRISDTPWFKHEHHVISPKEWEREDVRSRSNCSACHGKEIIGD